MPPAYYYSNTAQQTSLGGGVSPGATSIQVASVVGFPSSYPYVLALDYGAATEELVLVTGAALTVLTVTRGFGGTSAQDHGLGALVRHVYNAVDAADFRAHESAASDVHGVTGALVGATSTQTLTNKTLTAPTINNGTYQNGGSFAGTFTGTPTLSGAVVFSGAPSFTGQPVFTGNPVFQGASASAVVRSARVTGDGTPRLQTQADGKMLWGPGNAAADVALYRSAASVLTTDDDLLSVRATGTDPALSTRVTGDTVDRFQVDASGALRMGPGNAALDVYIHRGAAGWLDVESNVYIDKDLSVNGVGKDTVRYKAADLARSTATATDDPDLTIPVVAGAVYVITGMLWASTTDATTADLTLALSAPASTGGRWMSVAQDTTATQQHGTIRTVTTPLGSGRNYGLLTGGLADCLGLPLHGIAQPTASGNIAVNWARSGASGTVTLFAGSWLRLVRVA